MILWILAINSAFGVEAANERIDNSSTVPEVWVCHSDLNTLVQDDAEWDFVREHLTGIQFYIDQFNRYSTEEMGKLANMIREAGLKVSVECGGTLDFGPMDDTNGKWSAEVELQKFKKYTDAGGHIDYLNLDGPVRRLLYPTADREGFSSNEACAEQLVIYIREVLNVYPHMQFFLLTNFPNWGYKGEVSYHARGLQRMDWGDYHEVFQTVLRVLKAADLPLVGLTIDNPYEYAIGTRQSATLEDPTAIDWGARIKDLQENAVSAGLEVNMIINSESGGESSALAFHDETLKFLHWYLEHLPKPNRIFIQSWYTHPREVVPETQAGTMMALVKEAIQVIHSH